MKSLINSDPQVRAAALGSVTGFLAFGFGSGLSRFAPGTMGTLVAIPFVWGLKAQPPVAFWALLLFLFAAGVYLCGATAARLGKHDPGGIVWDEMVGLWLTVAFIPLTWPWLLLAFVLFRFFDILKPWPIGAIEKMAGGGFGIMIDDVLAAVYAMMVLAILQAVVGSHLVIG